MNFNLSIVYDISTNIILNFNIIITCMNTYTYKPLYFFYIYTLYIHFLIMRKTLRL